MYIDSTVFDKQNRSSTLLSIYPSHFSGEGKETNKSVIYIRRKDFRETKKRASEREELEEL